ncbi:MAG: hypothetical protein AMJ53_02115, partial [Gammaproteobacteria bacterium SG8_11]
IRERLQNRLQKAKDNTIQQALVKHLASGYVNTNHPGYEGTAVISASKLRAFTIKSVSKTIGVLLGIAVSFSLGINVFELIAQWTNSPDTMALGLFEVNLPSTLEYIITGIIMGLGSGPLHKFITALERARRKRRSTEAV